MIKNPPNIILVMADQLRYQSLGYSGDTLAITPKIDNFYQESFNFNQAITSMPVCSAMRASLFTGKYTHSTGMVINELRMNPNHRCLGHCLTDAGYDTGYVGKWHLWSNQLGRHKKAKNSFVPPGPNRLGFDGYWAAYNFHHEYYNAYYHENTIDKIYYPKGAYEPDAQTDMAIDYIKTHSDTDKPYFLMLSYGTPHDPWKENNVPEKYYKMFKKTKFKKPVNYSLEKDPHGDSWSNIKHSPKRIQKWKQAYYAMTTNLDWNFGRILEYLKENGREENTIVIFTSDHGELFGAHGRMKKNIFYDEAARVPFLLRWSKKNITNGTSEASFNTVDIMPTLLGMLNIPIPKEVEGVDFSPCFYNDYTNLDLPEYAFLMNTGACAAWKNGHEWRGLHSKENTYAIFRSDKEEHLYDNINDPYQMNNLALNEVYREHIESFRNKLKKKMEEIGDTFPESTWYRDNWIQNRNIMRTATLNTK